MVYHEASCRFVTRGTEVNSALWLSTKSRSRRRAAVRASDWACACDRAAVPSVRTEAWCDAHAPAVDAPRPMTRIATAMDTKVHARQVRPSGSVSGSNGLFVLATTHHLTGHRWTLLVPSTPLRSP